MRSTASAPVPSRQETPASAGKKWLVTCAVMSGTFLAVMDVSVVNVSMPHMMGNFGQTLSAITWVATSYSIAEMLMITMAGWCSALMGRKRLYLASFVLFTLGSMLAGTAQTFTQMLCYRILQGIGGGSLIPISQAILRETYPLEEQGMAMAIFGMGVVLAPAMGPILGGWLTDNYGWPWVFYINIPVSIVGILMVSAFVEDPPYLRRGVTRVDWAGMGLLTLGLTGMQVVLERGQENNWFQSRWITAGALLTGLALTTLVLWELRTREPIINFRVLRNVPLSVGAGMGLLFGMVFFGTTFSLPQLTQHLLHYSAYQAGLVLLPRSITLFLLMPLAGWLFNYMDPRLLFAHAAGRLALQLHGPATADGGGHRHYLLGLPSPGPALAPRRVLESGADHATHGRGHALCVCHAEHRRAAHRQTGGHDGRDGPLYAGAEYGRQSRLCVGRHPAGAVLRRPPHAFERLYQ